MGGQVRLYEGEVRLCVEREVGLCVEGEVRLCVREVSQCVCVEVCVRVQPRIARAPAPGPKRSAIHEHHSVFRGVHPGGVGVHPGGVSLDLGGQIRYDWWRCSNE